MADVTYLVNIIMNKKSEAKDGVYYWYIGIDNPSIISDIQTDRTVAGWHEIGPSLSGFVLDTNEGNHIPLSDTRVLYHVVIPNELHMYDALNMNMEGVFDLVTCNIPGYKAYKLNPDKSLSSFNGVRFVTGVVLKQ